MSLYVIETSICFGYVGHWPDADLTLFVSDLTLRCLMETLNNSGERLGQDTIEEKGTDDRLVLV